jgi:hypothetical protein
MKINTNLNGKKIYKCENWECDKFGECEERATDKHHLYSQTQYAKRTYGDIINQDFNIIFIPNRCHIWKSIPTWNEKEFIEHALEEGYRVQMPKSLRCNTFK